MVSKQHPADIADRKKIATATHFNVHLRRNPGDVTNTEAPNLIEAVKIADGMETLPSGKRPMIYAVTPDRQSIFVPAEMIEEARKDIEQIAAGLSSIEIAKLTAIITGGGYKRSNCKAAAEARFIKVASEAGISNAADIVRGPFDMAEHVIREKIAGKALTIAEVKSISINDPALADQPEAKVNEASWDAIPAVRAASKRAAREERVDADKPVSGKRAAILEAAQRGELPAAPDFTAPTHSRFRKKLAEIVAMVEAGDIEGLKAIVINPVSSSPKAMDKYRNLAVIALEAQAAKKVAA